MNSPDLVFYKPLQLPLHYFILGDRLLIVLQVGFLYDDVFFNPDKIFLEGLELNFNLLDVGGLLQSYGFFQFFNFSLVFVNLRHQLLAIPS